MTGNELLLELDRRIKTWKRASFEHGEDHPLTLSLKDEYDQAKDAYMKAREKEIATNQNHQA